MSRRLQFRTRLRLVLQRFFFLAVFLIIVFPFFFVAIATSSFGKFECVRRCSNLRPRLGDLESEERAILNLEPA
jgi:hypothetical protein